MNGHNMPFIVSMFKPNLTSRELTNEDRAKMVAPLVHAFGMAYYGNMGTDDEPELVELWGTIVSDLIGDLLHYFHQLDDEEKDDMTIDSLLERAHDYFTEELALEAGDAIEEDN